MKAATEVPQINHTNRHWYPYLGIGSYFRLENGTLLWRPMNSDGSMSGISDSEVDWDRGVSDEDSGKLRQVVHELTNKN